MKIKVIFVLFIIFLSIIIFLPNCKNNYSSYKNLKYPATGTYNSNNEQVKDYIQILDTNNYVYRQYGSDSVYIKNTYRFSNIQYDDGRVDCRITLRGFKSKFPMSFVAEKDSFFTCYYYATGTEYIIALDPQIDSYNFTLKK